MAGPKILCNFALILPVRCHTLYSDGVCAKELIINELIDISLHIEYLLRHHDCVIMPGIGAFLRSRQPARFNTADGVLEPPSERICFNSSITSSDGLLAHSVARQAGLSFEQALVAVDCAVGVYRQALKDDREITIGRLGTLYFDADECLCFNPVQSKVRAMSRSLLPAAVAYEKPVEEKAVVVNVGGNRDNAHKYFVFRIPRAVVRYASVLAVVLLTSLSLSVPSVQDVRHTDMASLLPVTKQVVEGSEPQAEPQAEDSVCSVGAENVVEAKYYVIVATFANSKDCERFIEQQNDPSGLEIISHGKVCRVACASSSHRDELLDIMRSDTFRGRFSQAWIWERP